MKISIYKLASAIILTILAIIYALPNFIKVSDVSYLPSKTVNLGLDLKGGSHLLLNVDFDKYLHSQIEILEGTIRQEFRKQKIGYKNLSAIDDYISFTLRNIEDFEKARSLIRSFERYSVIELSGSIVKVKYDNSKIVLLRDNVFDQSIEIIRMRVDSTGTKEPVIQKQGSEHILVQVPGENNPEYLKNILGQTANLSFHLVDENASSLITSDNALDTAFSRENIILSSKGETDNNEEGANSNKNEPEYKLALKKRPIITGDMLNNAQATFDQYSRPAVNFSLNNIGAKFFGEATRNSKGKRIAIVLDNKILSAPAINEPILNGNGIISGNFTVASAEDLALMLRAGALPAPLNIIEERTIGPNLGADSIESGKKAGLIGFIGVNIFMIWCYGTLGIFANIALTLGLVYILAMLSMFQATLTLPGIAGIILTIGMAVDANVLIYERIREELRKNTSNLFAVKQGFDTAFATISDSNITTLIAALLLYIFGTGAVKGFAVSLSIGIVASMFSAIVITKLLIDLWMKFVNPKSLGF